MKIKKSLFGAGFCLILLSAAGGLWSAAAAGAAVLEQVRGDVQIVAPGGRPDTPGRPAGPGDGVGPGEAVRTGPDSAARLRLRDGTVVEIFARTEVVFNEDLSDLEAAGHLLGLTWGRIFSRVRPRGEGGAPYKVVTPSSVCGVRGTEFMVAVADDGETRVGVERGEVEVEGTDGSERLAAGMETRVLVGRRPERPIRALLENVDWEDWMRERNDRIRERLGERVASLAETAKLLNARIDQLNRRIQKIEAEAREFARLRREAYERGEFGRARELETKLRTNLNEGAAVIGAIAEARGRREAALALGERALRGAAGPGRELSPELKKLSEKMEALRASLEERIRAEREVHGRRLESLKQLLEEYRSRARGPRDRSDIDARLLERWNKLSPEKREELKRRYEEWKQLPAETREKILSNWERFRRMDIKERREILKNLRDFERLGEEEKARIRERLERWRSLTPEKREEIKKKFQRFKSLSPEERRALLERLRSRRQSGPPPRRQ